jgi:hypothetical protein
MSQEGDGGRSLYMLNGCISCIFSVRDLASWLTPPIENNLIIDPGIFMYSLFFPKLGGVFVRESHAMNMFFDNVLGIVSP